MSGWQGGAGRRVRAPQSRRSRPGVQQAGKVRAKRNGGQRRLRSQWIDGGVGRLVTPGGGDSRKQSSGLGLERCTAPWDHLHLEPLYCSMAACGLARSSQDGEGSMGAVKAGGSGDSLWERDPTLRYTRASRHERPPTC